MDLKTNNAVEIDIIEVCRTLFHRWWLILLSAIVCAAGVFAHTYLFVTPMYDADVLMYVNNSSLSIGSVSVNAADLTASRNLIDTYGVILKSRLTLEEVAEKVNNNPFAHGKYTRSDLNKMVSSASVNNTEVLRIVVSCADPEDAAIIANCFAQVLPEKIAQIIEGTSVNIVDVAIVPSVYSSPDFTKNAIIGFAVGLVICAFFVFLFDYLVHGIVDSSDWVRETFGEQIPVLAVIPESDASHHGYGYYGKYGKYKYYGGYKYYGASGSSQKRKSKGKTKKEASDPANEKKSEKRLLSKSASRKNAGTNETDGKNGGSEK